MATQTITLNDATQNSSGVLRTASGDINTNIFYAAKGLRSAGHLYALTYAKTGDLTIDESTYNATVYVITTSGADATVTLEAAASVTGKVIVIKKANADAYKVVIDGNASETIEGKTTFNLYTKGDTIVIQSDGSAWNIIKATLSPVVIAKTANFTVDDQPLTEFVYVVTPAAATTATLPAVSGLTGRVVTFHRISGSTNNLIADGSGSETVDSATTLTSSTDHAILRLICTGSAWVSIAKSGTWA